MDSVGLDRCASLKAHKALPRKVVDPVALANVQVSQQVRLLENRLSQSQAKSETISSWIPDQSQVLPNPNLPLTPPSLPVDSSDSTDAVPLESENEESTQASTDTQRPSTPLVQRSPPTPDHTPPRSRKLPNGLLKPRSTPPLSSRNPSSTADSFMTAQEHFSSEDEGTKVASAPKIENPGGDALSHIQKVGLGLGLETPEGSRTPTMQSPKPILMEDPRVVAEDPFVATESFAVQDPTGARKLRRQRRGFSEEYANGFATPEDFQASLDRDLTLRERIEREKRHSASPSVERYADQIHWPSESDDVDEIHVDKKRLSELSSTSQVVQAFVLSTPPQRRQQLRRSSKIASLRVASSPLSGSTRSSLVSNDGRPRLVHRRERISDMGNRVSLNSDSGVSMGSDMRKTIEEVMPMSEIPKRRSSLKRSSSAKKSRDPTRLPQITSRHAISQSMSMPHQPSNRNIETRQQERAMSDATLPEVSQNLRGRNHQRTTPLIPLRSSSLSAPTTRNASRTTSLTSTSLHRHNVQQQQGSQPNNLEIRQGMEPANSHRERRPSPTRRNIPSVEISAEPQASDAEERPVVEETSRDRRQSLLTTPFSAVSPHSSTPGPFEVNEATAINIYPHSNTSVLVVQQMRQQGSERPRLSASLSGNVRIDLDKLYGVSRVPPSRRLMDSPLKNPRDPPPAPTHQRPAVMLIPPTPAIATPWSDASTSTRGRKEPAANSTFAMVRRALSARRYSESIVTPFTRSLVRHQSVGSRRRITGEEAPTKLSPFWRPRGFWDDLSDNESDHDEETEPTYVRNTLGLPQRRVIQGPSNLVRRLGSLKKRKRPTVMGDTENDTVDESAPVRSRFSGENDRINDVEKRVGILSRIRNTAHVAPFASLQEAIEKLKHKKVEERLEKQRERLRRNIGPVILQGDSQIFHGGA